MTTRTTPWMLTATALLAGWPLVANAGESVGTSSDPLVLSPAPLPRDSCRQGFVWRDARPGDHVCVTPATRADVARQNRETARLWVNGAYGPHTCVSGYVWREAFKGDTVCVRPNVRESVRQDNTNAARRRVGG